jgi:hypothetical protein
MLEVYFSVYSALSDEFKYRVLYDDLNQLKHFYRVYHIDRNNNFEYLNFLFNENKSKIKCGRNLELLMCTSDSKQEILFQHYQNLNKSEQNREGMIFDFFDYVAKLYSIEIKPVDKLLSRTDFYWCEIGANTQRILKFYVPNKTKLFNDYMMPQSDCYDKIKNAGKVHKHAQVQDNEKCSNDKIIIDNNKKNEKNNTDAYEENVTASSFF